jgi:hypothetical protein
VLLGGDAAAVGELLGADFEDKHLVERVDLERARAELELASGISSRPVPQPASRAGCPSSTKRRKYWISGPSSSNSAHSATRP